MKRISLGIAAALAVTACSTTAEPVEEVAAPEPAPVVEVNPAEVFENTVGSRVYFAYDSAALSAEARQTLRAQAGWLTGEDHDDINIVIAGNTDERGTRAYNFKLGEKRAQAAADFLVSEGVERDRIEVVSNGETSPVDPASNEAAWMKNRNSRTVLILAGS